MSTFLTLEEVIKLPMLGNNDLLQRSKGRFMTWAKYVHLDLNLTILKEATREYFQINKRTNSIDLPCEYTELSSVNVVDKHGVFYPVWRNQQLNDQIVEVAAGRDCACEFKCGYKLCNTIKGYEAITTTITDKFPDGSDISFACVERKAIDSQGFLYTQTQYPQRIYLSGVWTDTILHTENIKNCRVEVDKNGCVKDTEHNEELLCNTCCGTGEQMIPFGGNAGQPPCEGVDTWKYYCNSKADWFSVQCGQEARCHDPFGMIYNISEMGNRLIFPKHFGFDRVLVRYYKTIPLYEIKIPLIAVDAFVMGLKWWDARFDDKKQNLAVKYEQDYVRMKWGLLGELNKRRIAEYRMILTPPVFVPSYISRPTFYNNQNNYNH